MAENDGKKFFEIFDDKTKEKDLERRTGELSGEFQKNLSTNQEKGVLDGTKAAEEILAKEEGTINKSEKKDDINGVISKEGKETQKKDIEKKVYWAELIADARKEKIADDPEENQHLQDEKIMQEVIRIIAENVSAELKKGNAQKALDFFEKAVLPALKEENSEINEPAYLDEFHAGLKKWGEENGMEDWS